MTMVRSGWGMGCGHDYGEGMGCGHDYGEEWVGHGVWL